MPRMPAPRVAFLVNELTLGGATRQLAVLARALRPRVEPLVYCLSGRTEPLRTELVDAGVEVVVFRRPLRWNPGFVLQLERRLRDDAVDVVHGWQEAADAYGFLASRRLGLPVVFSLQSDRTRVGDIRGRIIAWMSRRVPAYTVNSRAGREHLVRDLGVAPDRALLVPNWIGIDIVPRTGPAPEPPVIAIIGRLVDIKRADLAIEALALLRSRGSEARLEIVGDGPERESLQARVAAAGLEDRVDFAGFQIDVRPVLERAACVVMPSEFEGLPNTAVEALAAGVPVVARPVGDLPDIVRDGITGRLVAEGSAEALATALAQVIEDTALAESTRREGPAIVRERFSIEAAIDTLAPLYERLHRKETGR